MKSSRAVVVGGASASIIVGGYLSAPDLVGLTLGPADRDPTDGRVYVDGPVVETQRGPVQMQLVLEGGEVVWINALRMGSPNQYTINITANALPVLRDRVLAAQDWEVDYVSGASFFSPGFTESVRGAFVWAGLTPEDTSPIVQPGEAADGRADYSLPGPPQPERAVMGAFAGPPVENDRGTYQAQIIVTDGVVTGVNFLQAGTMAAESARVNSLALPILRERILEAQSWDVEYVSGASFTSPAMIESARGAFEAAGLD